LIDPKLLADQHLIAEYNEILMLLGSVNKINMELMPDNYKLGEGHITFFKNKLKYLEERHGLLIKEMKNRGFNVNKKFEIGDIDLKLYKNWKPKKEDFEVIKERLIQKYNIKPNFYRYYKEKKDVEFFVRLLK